MRLLGLIFAKRHQNIVLLNILPILCHEYSFCKQATHC